MLRTTLRAHQQPALLLVEPNITRRSLHCCALCFCALFCSAGRIIEDAAMHEQYVRVITPEPAPTEETEEVRGGDFHGCSWVFGRGVQG